MFHARPDYEIRRVRGFSPRVTTHYSPAGRIEGTGRTLEIEFHHGVVCDSFDVPEDVYCDLLAAGSRGRHFQKHVRGEYEYDGRADRATSYNPPSGI